MRDTDTVLQGTERAGMGDAWAWRNFIIVEVRLSSGVHVLPPLPPPQVSSSKAMCSMLYVAPCVFVLEYLKRALSHLLFVSTFFPDDFLSFFYI